MEKELDRSSAVPPYKRQACTLPSDHATTEVRNKLRLTLTAEGVFEGVKRRCGVVSDREDNDAWHKLRRGWGDLAGARLFVFLRGSIWYEAYQYRSSHRPGDTDPLQTYSGLTPNFDSS